MYIVHVIFMFKLSEIMEIKIIIYVFVVIISVTSKWLVRTPKKRKVSSSRSAIKFWVVGCLYTAFNDISFLCIQEYFYIL